MKIEQFFYVLEVNRCGSLNKAAQNLFVSQPALSHAIKELENELNFKLFIRTPKGMIPTAAGEEFIEYAAQIVKLMKKITQIDSSAKSRGNEAFSVASIYSYTMLDLYQDFISQKEGTPLKISYAEMPAKQIINAVFENKADIGFTYYYDSDEEKYMQYLRNREMTFHPLISEPLSIILNSRDPLFQRKNIKSTELCDHSVIVEAHASEQHRKDFPHWFSGGNVAPVYFDTSRGAMYYLMKSKLSFYMGQYSLNTTNPFVLSGRIKYIPLTDSPYNLNTGYVVRNDMEITPVMEEFLQFIATYFRNHGKPSY